MRILFIVAALALLFAGPALAHQGGKHCHPDQECHGGSR